MTADTPAASKDGKAMPTKPGYYWAKWRIAADGTHEGDDLTPSDHWEIVEVNDNNGEPGSIEQFSVAVPGVRETQWPDCFVWGDFVAPLAGIEKAHPPSAAAHVATLTAKLEAERAKVDVTEKERDDWRAQYLTARDALHPLTYPPDPITLRAIADEIDCGRDCEVGYTEHDTNAFVCRKEERGECGWSKAEELRTFASAVEARRATLAQPAADGGAT